MGARKITVATTYTVADPKNGGQQRVVGLYGAFARRGIAVDVVSLAPARTRPQTVQILPGLREIQVPRSAEHERAEMGLELRLAVPVGDVALTLFHRLTPAYQDALRESAGGADAVVASHPYAYEALRSAAPDLPLLYEAQDVARDIKAGLLHEGEDRDAVDHVLRTVEDLERRCCADAVSVAVCLQSDAARLTELYGVPAERLVVVPNGVDVSAAAFAGRELRAGRRTAFGIAEPLVLFVGSWHGPNLEAALRVVDAARERPDLRFLILGSAGLALRGDALPANVDLAGLVHDAFLAAALGLVDVAVNPMSSGSGTNLKMLEYAAWGVPIVASAFGARGLGMADGEHYVQAEPERLVAGLATHFCAAPVDVDRRVRRAADLVREEFDWQSISDRWLQHPPVRAIIGAP